jgi:hypothetical protein
MNPRHQSPHGVHATLGNDGILSGISAYDNDPERAQAIFDRSVALWNAFEGVEDPLVELARLRALELSARLGNGVMSILPDHPGPGPWIICEAIEFPLLYLGPDGAWYGLRERAQPFTDYDQALDFAERYQAHVVPAVQG